VFELLGCHILDLLRSLPAHPNVVTFFGLAEGPGQLFIITEFMADGSLDKHLIRNQYAAPLSVAAKHY